MRHFVVTCGYTDQLLHPALIPEAIRADVTGKWTDEEEEGEEEEQHHFRSLSYVIVSSRPSFPLILSQANTPFTIVLQTWQEMN